MNALDVVRVVERELRAAGIDDARFEAEVLVRHIAGMTRASLFAGATLEPTACEPIRLATIRRASREPLAYILGTREFMGHDFLVTPAVLIPRPETELLVELVVAEAKPGDRIIDIGTGSGCIAISVALARPDVSVIAGDRSLAAIDLARSNANRLGAAVAFVRGDLASAISGADIVVANLPYIPSADIETLEPEVRDGEPRLALDGGADGLDFVRRLLDDCATRLRPRRLALELGVGQADEVVALASAHSTDARVIADLAGIDRVVTVAWQ